MRRFVISSVSSRPIAYYNHQQRGGNVFYSSPTTVSGHVTQLKDGRGKLNRWLMNRNFMSNPTNQPSYNESNFKDDEKEAIRIDVISSEHIKPSSPTPKHLRYYKLSIFDQVQAPVYNSITFFYPNGNNMKNVDEIIWDRLSTLKQSLSETLTRFYPYAGKVVNEFHIDCNDGGTYFIETRVNNKLMNVLRKPDNKFLQRLIPIVDSTVPNQVVLGSYISIVQANFFICGGVVVTIQFNHKLVDGFSGITFVKAWAAIARQDLNQQVYPSYVSSSMFPQISEWPGSPSIPLWRMATSPAYLNKGKCVIKRFVFDALSVQKIKDKASKHQPVGRIVAVLALLWKCVTVETQSSKQSFLHIPVNIRPRCSPAMPEYAVGNNLLDIFAMIDPNTSDLDIAFMAGELKKVVADVKSESIQELKGEQGNARFIENVINSMKFISNFAEAEHHKTTSLCNSGANKVDFGWGKPLWSFIGNLNEDVPVFMNRMIMMDSCSIDGGIEVWVTLEHNAMDALMSNSELLSFASVDPSPLNL